MLLVDKYIHFLTNFKDTSLLGWFKRWYEYKTFPKIGVNELCEMYKWNLYRMLNDFVHLYSRVDLFFKLSTYEEFKEEIFLDMRRVDIESEAHLLKDYTVYYTLVFDSPISDMKLTWNDKDEEVEGKNWATSRTWNKNNVHTGLMLDVAVYIIRFMDHVLDRFWDLPEKELNYQSVYILSMNIMDLRLDTSSIDIGKDFDIDLDTQCQYIHIEDHKYQEFISVLVQVYHNEKIYIANIKLSVTYINYRFEYLKNTYNPYVIDHIQQHRNKIVQLVRNIIVEFNEIH